MTQIDSSSLPHSGSSNRAEWFRAHISACPVNLPQSNHQHSRGNCVASYILLIQRKKILWTHVDSFYKMACNEWLHLPLHLQCIMRSKLLMMKQNNECLSCLWTINPKQIWSPCLSAIYEFGNFFNPSYMEAWECVFNYASLNNSISKP